MEKMKKEIASTLFTVCHNNQLIPLLHIKRFQQWILQ